MARKIHPDLLKFMLNRIPADRSWLAKQDPTEVMLIGSKTLLGVEEEGGNQGRVVELIQQTVDGKASKEAWCMAAVQTCIAFAEALTGKQSPIGTSEHCLTVYKKSLDHAAVRPARGNVVIWQHGSGPQGHTGLIASCNEQFMTTLEGNTSNGAGINRDGDGFYMRMRPYSPVGDMNIKGYLAVFP